MYDKMFARVWHASRYQSHESIEREAGKYIGHIWAQMLDDPEDMASSPGMIKVLKGTKA